MLAKQLSRDEKERKQRNVSKQGQKKTPTKKFSHLKAFYTGLMDYKFKCETYNLTKEMINITDQRNYWKVANIPNQTIQNYLSPHLIWSPKIRYVR